MAILGQDCCYTSRIPPTERTMRRTWMRTRGMPDRILSSCSRAGPCKRLPEEARLGYKIQ